MGKPLWGMRRCGSPFSQVSVSRTLALPLGQEGSGAETALTALLFQGWRLWGRCSPASRESTKHSWGAAVLSPKGRPPLVRAPRLCWLIAFIPKSQTDFRIRAKQHASAGRAGGFLYSRREMLSVVLEARNSSNVQKCWKNCTVNIHHLESTSNIVTFALSLKRCAAFNETSSSLISL